MDNQKIRLVSQWRQRLDASGKLEEFSFYVPVNSTSGDIAKYAAELQERQWNGEKFQGLPVVGKAAPEQGTRNREQGNKGK